MCVFLVLKLFYFIHHAKHFIETLLKLTFIVVTINTFINTFIKIKK